jgi:palmitoyltransferase ZDHHC9/14/18
MLILGLVFLATLYFFLKTATVDPGFVPYQEEDPYEAKNHQFFKNYLAVGGARGQKTHPIKLAYCPTCNIYRPPRTEHCEECDACV